MSAAPVEQSPLPSPIPATMRAWVYDRYGRLDVLQEREMPTPQPKRGQLLVRVRAAALNPKDGLFRRGQFRMLSGSRFPKFIGCDWAGEVVGLGAGVSGFAVGDRVYGALDEFRFTRGTVAQFVNAPAVWSAKSPRGLAFEDAAAVPLAAQTSLQALRDVAELRSGDSVLIHGASGGVGVYAIQIAKALGARVTTTSSARNFELCRELGADETLDYAVDRPFERPERFRVVFDAVGNETFQRARAVLERDGVYVSTVPSARLGFDIARTLLGRRRARLVVIRSRTADLEQLARWIEEGQLRAVVDRVYDFGEVREAFEHLESRRARGKIVIRIP